MSIFNKVSMKKPRYSGFDLTHERKYSCDMGFLIPFLVMDVVPGDKIKLSASTMLRFAPMLAPIMHRVTVYHHWFYVPNRILWPNWENFITGGEDGQDASVHPFCTSTSVGESSIYDYLGLPVFSGFNVDYNAIPRAAYAKIYNEYYRDQNLVTKITDDLIDGQNNGRGLVSNVLRRAWQHDYFTSCLPWTQKGPEALVPITGEADINWEWNQADVPRRSSGAAVGDGDVTTSGFQMYSTGDSVAMSVDNSANLKADLSSATAASINDLRQAFRLQEWLEKNARGGSRYTESILAHFGVHSSDARLQRPEFIGGFSQPVVISEVLQTSNNDTQDTPQGNMAGHAISVGGTRGFKYRCEEHGYIIGIMSVMPKTAYQQGLPRHYSRSDRFDYYWPEFAHLGEQPVFNKELYVADDGENENTFGYVPRYAEYKYIPSSVHGDFKTTLDFWHLGRKFATRPNLNQAFIECNPSNRIFAVDGSIDDRLWVQTVNTVKAVRPMPYFGTPSF